MEQFVDRFIKHWRGAIKGQDVDSNAFGNLIIGGDGSRGDARWESPVVSTTKEYLDGLTQFTNFFTEPTLTIFNTACDSGKNIASISYQLSFWYPTFWRPRIIIPGKLLLKISDDVAKVERIDDVWEVSLLDIFSKQFLPRLWDVWHILQTPCPEYVPVRELRRLGEVTISTITETICVEAKWCGPTKFPGPSVLTAAGFSLFGKLKTSRPVRDPIFTVLPLEVQSSKYTDSVSGEEMKNTTWYYHVPTALQTAELVARAREERFADVVSQSESASEDDLQDEIDYQTGIDNVSLMKGLTQGALRGAVELDEQLVREFESKESKQFRYAFRPRRYTASVDVVGEPTAEKISNALKKIKEVVPLQGLRLDESGAMVRPKLAVAGDYDSVVLGLEHHHCKATFNPRGEPAMVVYEIQYGWRLSKVFVELLVD